MLIADIFGQQPSEDMIEMRTKLEMPDFAVFISYQVS